MATRALHVHASFACAHSGVCCTAGWPVPVEPDRQAALGPRLLPLANGACPEFDADRRLCRVHDADGERALPRACHHFPRRARVDPQGTTVALSHFCPTAARALLDPARTLDVIPEPAAFPSERDYDGLDAREAWAPLVARDLLFDHASYDLWERWLVHTLGVDGATPDGWTRACLTVAAAAERLRAWPRQHAQDFATWTSSVVAGAAPSSPPTTADALARYAPYLAADVWHRVRATVPSGARLRADLSASTGADREPGPNRAPAPALTGAAAWARARYVAACAFGTWSAYDGWGVRSQLAELFVAAGVFEAECAHAADRHRRALDDALILEAVQQSDLLLRHLTDRAALCAWYHEAEWEV